METTQAVPYCGTPPVPGDLWSRWNPDPVLLVVLFAALFLWMRRPARAGETVSAASRRWFMAGWAALTLGLISPVCSLSVALFSARVGQHMWLALVAAPLLALATGQLRLPRRVHIGSLTAAACFALALWFWHLPRPYQLTFDSMVAYWVMHVTLTGSAWLFWRATLLGPREQIAARLLAGFLTLLQMGLLGALITFAPRLLYPVHALTAPSWQLHALEDQQLGALIMWVPGCTAIVIALLAMVHTAVLHSARAHRLTAAGRQ